MSKISDKSAPHGAGVGTRATERGDKTAREKLQDRIMALLTEQSKIMDDPRNLKAITKYVGIENQLHGLEDMLDLSDKQLETEYIYETEYLKKCPLIWMGDSDPPRNLRKCHEAGCPKYPCWHVNGLEHDDSDPLMANIEAGKNAT